MNPISCYVTKEGLFSSQDHPLIGTKYPRTGSVRVYEANEVDELLVFVHSALTSARSFAAEVPSTMGITVAHCQEAIEAIDKVFDNQPPSH